MFIDVQVAFDANEIPISINGGFFGSSNVIIPPASGSSYGGSTGILKVDQPVLAGDHHTQVAICDVGDGLYDSGVFFSFSPCSGSCNGAVELIPTSIAPLGTITTTSFLPTDSSAFTLTIPASGTVSGQFIIGQPSFASLAPLGTITSTTFLPTDSPAFTLFIPAPGTVQAKVGYGVPPVATNVSPPCFAPNGCIAH